MTKKAKSAINIVFADVEGSPDLIFVEIENDDGESISIGAWDITRDGFHILRIPDPPNLVTRFVCSCPNCGVEYHESETSDGE